MKEFLGVVLIIAGVMLGLWLGLWVMFVGGIVQILNAVKATPIESMGIAVGILRIVCSGTVGWVVGGIMVGFGKFLLI